MYKLLYSAVLDWFRRNVSLQQATGYAKLDHNSSLNIRLTPVLWILGETLLWLLQILSTGYHGYEVQVKDGLPESKRRNVATLIMMGNERKRERKIYIHAKTWGPLSLLYATSMREEEMKKSSNRIFVYLSLCHILYICECSSCRPPPPNPQISSFLQQCIVQAEIFTIYFVTAFRQPIFTSNLTP